MPYCWNKYHIVSILILSFKNPLCILLGFCSAQLWIPSNEMIDLEMLETPGSVLKPLCFTFSP